MTKMPDGRPAMIVVDPLTRKLVIPLEHVLETKAVLRNSIPSLCQLYLAGRCRQYNLCHQVHADPFVVHQLRMQVERLPMCCVDHGDDDFTFGLSEYRVVKLPGRIGQTVPMRSLSITNGLRSLLQAADAAEAPLIDLSHSGISLCRLHLIDRCRFAEDCKFLHVCKQLVSVDELPPPSPPAVLPSYHCAHVVQLRAGDLLATTARCGTPPSPELLSIVEPAAASMNGSTVLSGSFATASAGSTPIKKYRADSSWSYDPYHSGCVAYRPMVEVSAM
jgi:hypothetical protein